MQLLAWDALYKQCSGAAVATTQAIVTLSDEVQWDTMSSWSWACQCSQNIYRGGSLQGWCPPWVHQCRWSGMARLQSSWGSLNHRWDRFSYKLKGDGRVIVGVLPEDVPIQISNGNHCLHTFCRYIAEHWDCIKNAKPSLEPPLTWHAENLSKSAAEILAQGDSWWLVSIEYTCR